MTATEVKAKLLAVLDDVENGEEIEITRHGRTIARLSPARGPHALENKFKGVVWTTREDDDLLSTGIVWDIERDELADSSP
jgi:prevent-host-death family protein